MKESMAALTFVWYSQCSDADILLILNACEAACAEQPPFDGPVIMVTPETVDRWPVKEGSLMEKIQRTLSERE